MNKNLLKQRYEFTVDNKAIIDISVESITDLFNSFDKKAAFTNRELDQDFVDYLVDCAKELGNNNFIIRITIEKEFNLIQENNLRKAIKNHFAYMYEFEKLKFKKETRKFFLLMLLGISLLAFTSKYDLPDPKHAMLWVKTLREGLIIASWVAIWEATTAIFFGWTPYFSYSAIYRKILDTEIKVINSIKRITIN